MGLENRDYYRNTPGYSSGASGFSDLPSVCKALLIANVVVFVGQILLTRTVPPATLSNIEMGAAERAYIERQFGAEFPWEDLSEEDRRAFEASVVPIAHPIQQSVLQEAFQLDSRAVMRGQLWRLLTYGFCHDRHDVFRFAFTMLFLYWFGSRLETMYGSREFGLFYFVGLLSGGIAFVAFDWYLGSPYPAIGASGAVMATAVLYCIHHPYETIRIYLLFPVQLCWLLAIYLLYDLHPLLLALGGDYVGIGLDRTTNLGGAAFAYGYFQTGIRLQWYWERLPFVSSGRSRSSPSGWRYTGVKRQSGRGTRSAASKPSTPERPKLRIFGNRANHREEDRPAANPELERLELSLDQVLEKIHREGREVLTDDEVAVLEKASKTYRDR